MNIELQQQSDLEDVETLLDIAFGEDRFDKASYAFRKNVKPIDELSFIVRKKGNLIATLRFWPIKIAKYEALLLGPIAVLPSLQGQGYGIKLMQQGLERAAALGHLRVVLVGDEAYYSRIGFSRACAKNITMPAQDDMTRVLALELVEKSFFGVVGAISDWKN